MGNLLTLLDLVDAQAPELHAGNCIGADMADGETIPAVGADLEDDRPAPSVAADLVTDAPAVCADLGPGPAEDQFPN